MREWPELVGRTYLEVLTMFPDAVPLGIRTPEGNHLINPEDTFVIHQGQHCAHTCPRAKAALAKQIAPQDRIDGQLHACLPVPRPSLAEHQCTITSTIPTLPSIARLLLMYPMLP